MGTNGPNPKFVVWDDFEYTRGFNPVNSANWRERTPPAPNHGYCWAYTGQATNSDSIVTRLLQVSPLAKLTEIEPKKRR